MFSRRRYTYGRRYYRKGTVRRSMGSARAAKKGTKQEQLNCTIQGYINFEYGATNPPLSNVIVFHPFVGGVFTDTGTVDDSSLLVHGGAINDRSFRLKCSQYDEVKLNTMKVSINPVVSASSSTTPQMILSTIWDRKASVKEVGLNTTIPSAITGRMPKPEEVTSNEGAVKTTINMNSTRGISRMCFANNTQEKSFYWDSTVHYNETAEESPLKRMILDAWEKKEGFAPALYVVSELNQTTVFGSTFTCGYKVEYNFTFRNPKSELDDFIKLENLDYTNPLVDGRAEAKYKGCLDYMYDYAQQKEKTKALLRGIPDDEQVFTQPELKKVRLDEEEDKKEEELV